MSIGANGGFGGSYGGVQGSGSGSGTGSGSAGQVTLWSGPNTIKGDSGLTYANTGLAFTLAVGGGITTSGQAGHVLLPYGVAAGNTGELRFRELAGGGVNYVGFKAADALAGNQIWTLPAAVGAAGSVLTDAAGNGILSWAAGGGGGTPGGSDTQFQYNNAGAFGGTSFMTVRAAGFRLGPAGTNDTDADSMTVASAAGKKGMVFQFGNAVPTQPVLQAQMSDGTRCFEVQTDGGMIIDQRTAATYSNILEAKYAGVRKFFVDTNGVISTGGSELYLSPTLGIRTDGGAAYTIGSGGSGFNGYFAQYTNTATVGPVVINKPSGRVNMASGAASVVVTNSLVTADSHVLVTRRTNDTTALLSYVTSTAGSFTIFAAAAATANTAFDFFVVGAD